MASIFSLFGEVLIDNTNANKSIDQTTEKAENSGSKVGSAFSSIAKGAAAVGTAVVAGAAAVGGAAYKMAKDTAAAADEVDKMSQKLGMSREAYQEWDYVLSQSGVEITSMSTGLKTLTNKIDDAKNGSDSATAMFEKLGISLEDLNNMSREEAFDAVIKGMQGMEDSTERAALANDLFGKSGQELTALFNQTAESTENLKNQAHELGMVMSDETINAGVEFTDTLDTLKRSFGGLANSLGGAILPIIQNLLGLVIENLPKIQELFRSFEPIFSNLIEQVLPPIFSFVSEIFSKILPPLISLLTQIFSEILPPLISLLTQIFSEILPPLIDLLTPIFTEILPPLISLLTQIFSEILPPLISLLTQIFSEILPPLIDLLTPIFSEILPPLISLLNEILGQILPPLIDLLTPIFTKILPPLIDLLTPIFTEILPPLISLLNEILGQILPPLISLLTQIFSKILPPLEAAFSSVAQILSGTFKNSFETIGKIITNVKNIFSGITDFIKNVFTGNWRGAWESVVKIFSNIFEGIKNAFKVPINWIIDGINVFIRGLNKLKIPDWVPGIGGYGLNIKELSRLRIGLEYVPYDEYPALLHKGERVLTEGENKEYNKAISTEKTDGEGKIAVYITLGERAIYIERLDGESEEDMDGFIDRLLELIAEKIKRKGLVFG